MLRPKRGYVKSKVNNNPNTHTKPTQLYRLRLFRKWRIWLLLFLILLLLLILTVLLTYPRSGRCILLRYRKWIRNRCV